MKNKTIHLIFLLFISVFLTCCKSEKQPTIHLIGDSTMANKANTEHPERGWGQLLPEFFQDDLKIINHAVNGRSTRSFIYEGRWDKVLEQLSKGDYLIIQFGHNDGSESKVARYATPEEYRYNLINFVNESRTKGAIPVLCTPIVRRRFNSDGEFYDTHGVYPEIVKSVAASLEVILVDMHLRSMNLLKALGLEKSKELFLHFTGGELALLPDGLTDDTHFSEKGAKTMANLFVLEILKFNTGLHEQIIIKSNDE